MQRILRAAQQINVRQLDAVAAAEKNRCVETTRKKFQTDGEYLNRAACALAIDCRMSCTENGGSNDPSDAHVSVTGQLFTINRRGHSDVDLSIVFANFSAK